MDYTKLTLNSQDLHLKTLHRLLATFCLNAGKYLLEGTQEILSVTMTYLFHLCRSMHVGSIPPVVVLMGWGSEKI